MTGKNCHPCRRAHGLDSKPYVISAGMLALFLGAMLGVRVLRRQGSRD